MQPGLHIFNHEMIQGYLYSNSVPTKHMAPRKIVSIFTFFKSLKNSNKRPLVYNHVEPMDTSGVWKMGSGCSHKKAARDAAGVNLS